MNLIQPTASIYVPGDTPEEDALSRTTHLAIGAHQDDIEIMAYHGIVECYHQPDNWFTGVTVTNGSGSARTGVYGNYTDEEMREVRVHEQRKAAMLGEYSCQLQLMYPSSDVKDAENPNVVDDMLAILQATKPRTVYLHNLADKHDTHVATALRSLSALRELPEDEQPETVYGMEVWRDLDWLMDADKQVLPVDRFKSMASALLGIFDSQISGGKRYDLAALGRRLANATFLESHAVDANDNLSFGVDLTPLVKDKTLSIPDYVGAYIERFRADVEAKLAKFS
jgi:LmbE family N-acetylglucosaminyl deacetylase